MEHRTKSTLIDLSHVIEEGMTTFKGLPGPHICDYWSRETSADSPDRDLYTALPIPAQSSKDFYRCKK